MVQAKKSLGQHFLRHPSVAGRIAEAIHSDAETIVEIGPGHGILTTALLSRGRPLVIIEKDDVLSEGLQQMYGEAGQVTVVHGDFLKFPLDTLPGQLVLTGNFPYNISSQIVFRMLDFRERIPEMVGMFQLEMGRRIVSSPGSKEYGVISVLTQLFYDGELLFTVPPEAFIPPPRVQSAIIRLRRKEHPSLPADYGLFRRLVKQAFGQRRKMLRNTLRGLIPDAILKGDPLYEHRPEQLSVEMFCKLTDIAQSTSNP